MDFLAFTRAALIVHNYSRMKIKRDGSLTLHEMLDFINNNLAPMRLNDQVAGQFIELTTRVKSKHAGIDIVSFTYLDSFHNSFAKYSETRHNYLNISEYLTLIYNPFFPNVLLNAMSKIPLLPINKSLTENNRLNEFYTESDYLSSLPSFLERQFERTDFNKTSLNMTSIATMIFNVLDHDNDGYIDFLAFGNLFSLAVFS